MSSSRYALPGFRKPEAEKQNNQITLRPGGSIEIDLGPAYEGAPTPAFTVRVLLQVGSSQECCYASDNGELIFHQWKDGTKRLHMIIYHSALVDTLVDGNYILSIEPDLNSLKPPYEERYGQYVAVRELRFIPSTR